MHRLNSFRELPESCPNVPRGYSDAITPEFSFYLRGESGIYWRAQCSGDKRCNVCGGDGGWDGQVTSSPDLAYLCGTMLLDRANASEGAEREFLHKMASELLRWSATADESDSA